MAIKMLAGFAGTGFTVSPGDVTDRFSEAEELRMIEAGFAEVVQPDGPRSMAQSASKPKKKAH